MRYFNLYSSDDTQSDYWEDSKSMRNGIESESESEESDTLYIASSPIEEMVPVVERITRSKTKPPVARKSLSCVKPQDEVAKPNVTSIISQMKDELSDVGGESIHGERASPAGGHSPSDLALIGAIAIWAEEAPNGASPEGRPENTENSKLSLEVPVRGHKLAALILIASIANDAQESRERVARAQDEVEEAVRGHTELTSRFKESFERTSL